MITLDTAGTFDKIVLRFPLQLAAGTRRRAVVARPCYTSVDEDQKFRWGTGIVQSRTAHGTPAQFFANVPLRIVVPGDRRAEALFAYR